MAPFGTKVRELLAANNLTAEWLHDQTGISKSAISDWETKPNVSPKPSSVKKVARALESYGVSYAELAEAADLPYIASRDETEREARRRVAMRAKPRLARHFDHLIDLPGQQQDEILSVVEAIEKTITRRRKGPTKS